MKRIIFVLLILLVGLAGCSKAVSLTPSQITTTSLNTWDSIKNLPVGTVVYLEGYVYPYKRYTRAGTLLPFYGMNSQKGSGETLGYSILFKNGYPVTGSLVQLKAQIEPMSVVTTEDSSLLDKYILVELKTTILTTGTISVSN